MSKFEYITIQPAPVSRNPNRVDQSRAKRAGSAVDLFHTASLKLNSYAVTRRVEHELKALEPEITKIMPPNGGVLVVVGIKEWAMADATGSRAQSFMSLHIGGTGASAKSVVADYINRPRMVQGAPRGWRRVDSFVWIASKKN